MGRAAGLSGTRPCRRLRGRLVALLGGACMHAAGRLVAFLVLGCNWRAFSRCGTFGGRVMYIGNLRYSFMPAQQHRRGRQPEHVPRR